MKLKQIIATTTFVLVFFLGGCATVDMPKTGTPKAAQEAVRGSSVDDLAEGWLDVLPPVVEARLTEIGWSWQEAFMDQTGKIIIWVNTDGLDVCNLCLILVPIWEDQENNIVTWEAYTQDYSCAEGKELLKEYFRLRKEEEDRQSMERFKRHDTL